MFNQLPGALGMTLVLVLLGVAPSARAAEPPVTPTITALSVVSPVVPEGQDVELAWTGDDGGVELFVVRATFRDFDWGTHEMVDGVSDTPTTGVMRAAVDSSWASGPAVPIKVEIFDIGGDGRVYYADDPRTPENEQRTTVWRDARIVDTEYGGADIFSGIVVNIREELTDTEAPHLTSVSLTQSTLLPGGSVQLNWTGSDDHSGIRAVRIKVVASDGTHDEIIEEFVVGKPPTAGQVQIPVPDDAVEGIYQVTGLGIFDNACNERQYSIGNPDAEPMSGTTSCATGYVDPETRVPADLSIAPLTFGVIMERPPMASPDPPTDLSVTWGADKWLIDWESASAWQDDNSLRFYDWMYQVEVDDEVSGYAWPDTAYSLGDDSIRPGEHTVRIRAVNRFGPGPWSPPVTFSTEPSGPVTALAATGRLWGTRVAWAPPATAETAEAYVVMRRYGLRTVDQMPLPQSTDVGVTSRRFNDRAVEPSRSYTYAVFALDAQGQISEPAVAHLSGTRTKVRATDLRPRHEVELRGRVADTDGNGVSGVRVLVQKASSADPSAFIRTRVVSTTTADGSYRVSLTPRRGYEYRVATPGGPAYGPSWSRSFS